MAEPGELFSPSTTRIEDLLTTLHSAVNKTWKSALISNNRQKRHYSSLLRLKAFQSPKFTDTEKYKQGRRALAFYSAKETKDIEEARSQQFKDLMGSGPTKEKVYLSREVLNGKDMKTVFRRFRRRFGEIDHSLYSSKSKPVSPVKPIQKTTSKDPAKRTETNKYVQKHMRKIFHSNSVSKGTALIRSATDLMSPHPTCQSPTSIASSPMSLEGKISWERKKIAGFQKGETSRIKLMPAFLSLLGN